MATMPPAELFSKLIGATKPTQIQAILRELGDGPDVLVDVPFGGTYQWRFYGNRESNMSTINLATKPGRSLTERVTNAVDAVIEKRARRATGPMPESPMDAAGRYFGRPPSTADNGLFAWKTFPTQGYDRLVHVVMTDGDVPTEPTVDIVDDGVGMTPEEFPDTIVSLQEGNKIKKRYLAGSWGQGGSSTLAFSDYVFIGSRNIDAPSRLGFTLIKVMRLPEPYKENAYVYLCQVDAAGTLTVPNFEFEDSIDLYRSVPEHSAKPKQWTTGTFVRQYGYELGQGLSSTLSSSPGNLYHLLQHTMLDPLLPFRIVDLETRRPFKNERISGSRNRLMARVVEAAEEALEVDSAESEAKGSVLRHHSPREMVSPRAGEGATIGIEYWVVLNNRTRGDKTVLRTHSNELYVSASHPIVGTVNGQNQGELTGRILSQLRLPMVGKHIVIHIDATEAERDVRRELFSSTREGFKDGEVLTELIRVLRNRLREDEALYQLERELVGNLLQSESSEAKSLVRKQITGLLKDAGLQVMEPGEVLIGGGTGRTTTTTNRTSRSARQPSTPLDTLPYPQVTRFEIIDPKDVLHVAVRDNQVVRVETDADFRYGRENRLAIRSEPALLEVASQGLLRGGRMNWRLRPVATAKPGDIGEVIATLTRPDGSQLESKVMFEVMPAREEPGRAVRGMVPAFDVRPINPDDSPEQFESIWDDLGPDDDMSAVAYKVMQTPESLIVWYSTAFKPYREQVEQLGKRPVLAAAFSQTYEIWIGYHAILQWQQSNVTSNIVTVDETELSRLQEHERAVVATMQVKQAMQMAELQEKAVQSELVE